MVGYALYQLSRIITDVRDLNPRKFWLVLLYELPRKIQVVVGEDLDFDAGETGVA